MHEREGKRKEGINPERNIPQKVAGGILNRRNLPKWSVGCLGGYHREPLRGIEGERINWGGPSSFDIYKHQKSISHYFGWEE